MQGTVNRFAIRPLMRELIVYAGHLDRYAKSEEIQEKFTRVKAGTLQVYRVIGHAGESLEDEEKRVERILPSIIERRCSLCRERRFGAVYPRERLVERSQTGRLFKGGDCPNPDGNASCLEAPQCVARLGNSEDFGKRLQKNNGFLWQAGSSTRYLLPVERHG